MPSVIRAAKIGDAAIIKSIIKILANEKIQVISSIFYNPELALKKGNYSKIKPTKQDIISIKKGKTFFSKINNLDHIQALVVKNGKIIAKAWFNGITIVINGTEINVMEPPKPDFAIPYKIIAGMTVKKNNRFISIYYVN